ncbi:MAG: BamA/TamA family outer membrane protein [Prevotella sp.]
MTPNRPYIPILLSCLLLGLCACSSTSGLEDGEQLYTGLKKIEYTNYEPGQHFENVKTEVEAALAAAPNGALLGSSYYTTPLQWHLWIWNAWHDDTSRFGQWMTRSFGRAPILMSAVNPQLRASIAQSLLQKHGYFQGRVRFENLTMRNPKKGKIQYHVAFNRLYTLDTIRYVNFPPEAEQIIAGSMSETLLHQGDAFDVAVLDKERQRLSTLFRDSGFYYYQPSYASYLADTVSKPGQVQVHLQMADSIPYAAQHKWYLGKIDVMLRKNIGDSLPNVLHRRTMDVHYSGKRLPLRVGVIRRNMPFRPKKAFSYSDYQTAMNSLSSNGLFSMVNFNFTPRDTSKTCDTLDLKVNCLFDKPYDFYVETNVTGKTTNRVGPGIVMGLTKRNAFRGGETLDLNVYGNYEWQTGHQYEGSTSKMNSYEYGMDASLTIPRFLLPSWIKFRHRHFRNRSTLLKASSQTINRANYFKRHIVSGELTYKFQTSAQSLHEFSPLILQYDYMVSSTAKFDSIRKANPYLEVSMRDQFIPKMRYRYSYQSPATYRNPIYWEATFSEAANLLSLGYMAFGDKWGDKNKKMFKNAYAQFVKLEAEIRKTWSLTQKSSLVGHLAGGIVVPYGNSASAPYSEQFYVGGANSVRAFNVRSIGPGSYSAANSNMSYLDQTGDIKFLANLEYRFPLFGNLYGATFLDAGNVWALKDTELRPGSKFKFANMFDELAVGTGIGLRYDLDYFVIRVDWGIGLHAPYNTGKKGFYNMPNFKDSQTLHIAVGYPF